MSLPCADPLPIAGAGFRPPALLNGEALVAQVYALRAHIQSLDAQVTALLATLGAHPAVEATHEDASAREPKGPAVFMQRTAGPVAP
jgi:prefoldin subunit 5